MASETAGASITPNVTNFNSSPAGQAITFTVNVDNPALAGKWVYGTVTLTNNSGDGRPNLKLPVAVYASPFSTQAFANRFGLGQRNVTTERGVFELDVEGMVPLPSALQLLALRWAMLFTTSGEPAGSTVPNTPPTYRPLPPSGTMLKTGPLVPPPTADHRLPSHCARFNAVTPPAREKSPPT